jgi:protein-disulfide isomerase
MEENKMKKQWLSAIMVFALLVAMLPSVAAVSEDLPDLAITGITSPNDVLTIHQTNKGNSDVETLLGHTYIYIDDMTNPVWTYSWSTLESNRQAFLEAGQTSTIQPQVLTGEHTVKACIDYTDIVEESDESNNCFETLVNNVNTPGPTETVQEPIEPIQTVPEPRGYVPSFDEDIEVVAYMGYADKFSKRAWPIVQKLTQKFDADFEFKHFPLAFHEFGKEAAIVGVCVEHEEGEDAFLRYSTDLMEENGLDMQDIKVAANAVDVDAEECLEEEKYAEQVEEDLEESRRLGISGSPTFFINGHKIEGAHPYATFARAFERMAGQEQPDQPQRPVLQRGERVTQKIKCVFHGSDEEQKCGSTQSKEACVGEEACVIEAYGHVGDVVKVESSCSNQVIPVKLTGQNDYAEFKCGNDNNNMRPIAREKIQERFDRDDFDKKLYERFLANEEGCKDGQCATENACVNVGLRMVEDGRPAYCDVSGDIIKQKTTGQACQNNFECTTNACSSGVCTDLVGELRETQTMVKRLSNWLQKLFSF